MVLEKKDVLSSIIHRHRPTCHCFQLLSPSSLQSISCGDIIRNTSNPLHQAVPSSSACHLTSPPTSAIHQLNSNIWQLCIQLEGVACFAQALQRDFRPLLMTVLYPLLEKASDESLLVSQAALGAMTMVGTACGYASLKEMIRDNSDYLLNDVSVNLQRLGQHPEVLLRFRGVQLSSLSSAISNLVTPFSHPTNQAPRVLTVMLAHSDCSLLPLVGDIVQDVLMALDLSYDQSATLFGSVLLALMKALGKEILADYITLVCIA